MTALVTGAAGFIGSTLVDHLLAAGTAVVGVDNFSPYYERTRKEANLQPARTHDTFRFVEADLRSDPLDDLLDGVDVIYHLAAQPGVRLSWSGFAEYDSANVLATQRLLELVHGRAQAGEEIRLVFASSSSVYGNAPSYPTSEQDQLRPFSPYAVTKVAAEHLCRAYTANFGLDAVVLRYFTVYGPRQRPDMAMARLVAAAHGGTAFPLFGDGSHVRDFTYVDDVVRATIAAGTVDLPAGTTVNVAGGASTTMADLIDLVGELAGAPVPIDRRPPSAGDVDRTGGAIDRARELLDWKPLVDVRTGLAAQLAAHPAP